MTALSESEAAAVQRFENGEPAPESAVERVARALAHEDQGCTATWDEIGGSEQNAYRRLARAALAVMAGPDDTTRAVLAVSPALCDALATLNADLIEVGRGDVAAELLSLLAAVGGRA